MQVTINQDQQKRLLAAEMAMKSRLPDENAATTIENAKKWLEYLDGGKFNIDKASMADVVALGKK